MAMTAAAITSRGLGRRIEVVNPADELGRLAATLNDMIARLERSFEEVHRFTADAAHELRTPLTLIRAEVELALRDRDGPPDPRVLRSVLEEVDRLSRLVGQLLALCREDAGLDAPEALPVRLDELARGLAEHMAIVGLERGQALGLGRLDPCWVLGDEDRLRRLVFNLLDNAIKYTPEGGEIRLEVRRDSGQALVTVEDSGIGIEPEHLPFLFDRFHRVDPARGRVVEGTGLGLAICRSIAESHGGRIEIESAPGRGTRVTVRLPDRD